MQPIQIIQWKPRKTYSKPVQLPGQKPGQKPGKKPGQKPGQKPVGATFLT